VKPKVFRHCGRCGRNMARKKPWTCHDCGPVQYVYCGEKPSRGLVSDPGWRGGALECASGSSQRVNASPTLTSTHTGGERG